MPDGFGPAAELVVEPSQVEVGIRKAGVGVDSLLVGGESIAPATQLLQRGAQIERGRGMDLPALIAER